MQTYQISEYCHTHSEPVYITKNGKGDLVVLDIETYEKLVGRFELSTLLDQGLEDVKQKNYKNADEFFDELERRFISHLNCVSQIQQDVCCPRSEPK